MGVDGSSGSSIFALAALLLFVFPLVACDGFIGDVDDVFNGNELRPKNSINSGLKNKINKNR
jgi:hypothetical protein